MSPLSSHRRRERGCDVNLLTSFLHYTIFTFLCYGDLFVPKRTCDQLVLGGRSPPPHTHTHLHRKLVMLIIISRASYAPPMSPVVDKQLVAVLPPTFEGDRGSSASRFLIFIILLFYLLFLFLSCLHHWKSLLFLKDPLGIMCKGLWVFRGHRGTCVLCRVWTVLQWHLVTESFKFSCWTTSAFMLAATFVVLWGGHLVWVSRIRRSKRGS